MRWFGLCAQSIWHKTILWRLQKDPVLGLNRPIQHWRSKTQMVWTCAVEDDGHTGQRMLLCFCHAVITEAV